MGTFFTKAGELLCAIANVAPTILVKIGEASVVIGESVKKVFCPGV